MTYEPPAPPGPPDREDSPHVTTDPDYIGAGAAPAHPAPIDPEPIPEPEPTATAIGSIAEYARRLGELRAARKSIETEEEAVRRIILDHLESTGESQVFTASGQVAATLRVSVRSSINRAKLEAVYPEVFADVVTATRIKSIWLP